MNRRLKAFWAQHEQYLAPAVVALALVVGDQVGEYRATDRLTTACNKVMESKDARIRELNDRAHNSADVIRPAVDAAVKSAEAAAKSADASAKAVEQVVKDQARK